jgi:hypothetical protein
MAGDKCVGIVINWDSNSSQLTLDCFVKKRPHPASIMADMKSNKRYRKPD